MEGDHRGLSGPCGACGFRRGPRGAPEDAAGGLVATGRGRHADMQPAGGVPEPRQQPGPGGQRAGGRRERSQRSTWPISEQPTALLASSAEANAMSLRGQAVMGRSLTPHACIRALHPPAWAAAGPAVRRTRASRSLCRVPLGAHCGPAAGPGRPRPQPCASEPARDCSSLRCPAACRYWRSLSSAAAFPISTTIWRSSSRRATPIQSRWVAGEKQGWVGHAVAGEHATRALRAASSWLELGLTGAAEASTPCGGCSAREATTAPECHRSSPSQSSFQGAPLEKSVEGAGFRFRGGDPLLSGGQRPLAFRLTVAPVAAGRPESSVEAT